MLTLISIIALALIFDFINGFHDAANSVATIVSTRVMTPRMAVLWAAFFNFAAFLVFETHVATNIAKGVNPSVVTLGLVASGLIGAIAWDLITWWWGLPTSSSHALMGGIAGAAIAKAGFGCLDSKFFIKTGIFIILAPLIGFTLGTSFMRLVNFLCKKVAPNKVDKVFRVGQFISASLYSLGHGGNDAQKTMGIIAAALVSTGHLIAVKGKIPHIPLWIVLTCHLAMGLGTMFGGWRIVKTMGMKITKLAPVGGFCAETAGAFTLFMATKFGIPVSTTHTITGSIVGVGSTKKLSAIRWGVAGRIVWAWVLTVPCSALVSALMYKLISLI